MKKSFSKAGNVRQKMTKEAEDLKVEEAFRSGHEQEEKEMELQPNATPQTL